MLGTVICAKPKRLRACPCKRWKVSGKLTRALFVGRSCRSMSEGTSWPRPSHAAYRGANVCVGLAWQDAADRVAKWGGQIGHVSQMTRLDSHRNQPPSVALHQLHFISFTSAPFATGCAQKHEHFINAKPSFVSFPLSISRFDWPTWVRWGLMSQSSGSVGTGEVYVLFSL